MVARGGGDRSNTRRSSRHICFFTGTRAEYGLLRPLIDRVVAKPEVRASLLITGSHLSSVHGGTDDEIATKGLVAVERAAILDGDDSDVGIARAMGKGVRLFAESLARLKPDLVVLLGDRYEALALACAATICKVPLAHLHGGELSLGAMDDVFRHAITKMSHLHFCSTETYRRRVIAMGEHPERVFNVGALGVENALHAPLLDRATVEARLGLAPGQTFILMTFHPETLDRGESSEDQLLAVLRSVERMDGIVTIATGANADAGGQRLNAMLVGEAERRPAHFRYRASLGSQLYLSALKYCHLVIGNSSSGVIEAPSFGVPVIDIGSRQAGRIKSAGLIPAQPNPESIAAAIQLASSDDFRQIASSSVNPYQQVGTSRKITDVLTCFAIDSLLSKGFHDASIV